MNMRTIGIAVIVVALVAAFTGIVSAVPDGAEVAAGATSSWAAQTAETDDAAGGDITALDLTIDQSTTKWQGYWGSITDMIVLADASGNKMYDWGTATILTGEVFATTGDSPAWASVTGVTTAERDEIDTLWGWSASADDAGETFTVTDASVTVAGTTASDAVATVVGAILPEASSWQTVVITDVDPTSAKGDYIFVGIIHEDTLGYDGATNVDYQMIVPGDDTYYFYVEVG
jgi:hypothetical protein